MYESHEDDEKKEDEGEKDEDEKEEHEEDAEEVVFGGASPKHGVKPKLPGVPVLK